jgi:nucleoside-diphosphate-sugar epimerase
MKILITGGSGYFGTRLVELLSRNGYDVVSFDIGYFWNCWLGAPLKLQENKTSASKLTSQIINQFDLVLHFAGISNDPLKNLNESSLYDPSIEYSLQIAEICRANKIRFIFASSCSVYGYQEFEANENSVLNPQTPYSMNKMQIEDRLLKLRDQTWSPLILRFSTIFGFSPRMRFDTVINMLCGLSIVENEITLNSNGEAMRPFLYIDDAINIIECFINIPSSQLEEIEELPIYNIGSNNLNFKIKAVGNFVAEISKKPVVYKFDGQSVNLLTSDRKIQDGVDKRSYQVNFNKLNSILNLKSPVLELEEGINKTISKLVNLSLSSSQFYDYKFYRLQFLENCVQNKTLNKDLQFN